MEIIEQKAAEKGHRLLAAMVKSANDAIIGLTPDRRIIAWNPSAEKLFGYSAEEAIGQDVALIIPPERAPEQERLVGDASAGRMIDQYETVRRRKDGGLVDVSISAAPILDEKGKMVGIAGIFRDITEGKRAEAARRQSQKQYESLVNSIDGIVWELDYATFKFTFVSPQAERILGYPVQQWFTDPDFWPSHIHPDDRAGAVNFCLAATERLEDHQFEYRMIAADGRHVWLRDIVTVEVKDGRPAHLRGVMVDITARKQEEVFRAEQGRVLELIATGAPLAEILTSLVRLIESQSEGMRCSILLLDDDGLHVRHGAAPSLPEFYVQALDGAQIGPQAGSCGTAMYWRRPVVVSDIEVDPLWEGYRELAAGAGLRACWSTPIISHQGKVLGSFAVYYSEPRSPGAEETRLTEIATHLAGIAIERQLAEEALRQSEARTRAILQAIPDLMLLLSSDGICLDYHAKNPDELPVPPEVFLGKTFRDVLPPGVAMEAALCFQRASESDRSQSFEFELLLNGAVQHYETRIVRSSGDRFLGLVRNVTARRRAQEQLRRAQAELAHVSRVTTMGELAASIAHEVNQPLGAIVGNADICLHWLGADQPDLTMVREALSDIVSDGHRASEVISRVRALAKKSAPHKTQFNLDELVGEVLALVGQEARRRRVTLRAEPGTALPVVEGDRVQLQQVLLNLVMNGIEAMAGVEGRARELTVSTCREQGGEVLVTVKDCGAGIDREDLDQLFKAFHTTKEEGLGMGLAISRSIVEAHGGRLWAEANHGPGATFQFTLPAQVARVA